VPLPGPPLGASGVGSKVGTLGGTGKEGRKNGKSDDEGACARPSLHRVAWESASPRRENRARGKGHLRIRKHQTSHAIVQFTVSPGMVMFSQLHTQSARRKGGRCTRYGSAGGGKEGEWRRKAERGCWVPPRGRAVQGPSEATGQRGGRVVALQPAAPETAGTLLYYLRPGPCGDDG